MGKLAEGKIGLSIPHHVFNHSKHLIKMTQLCDIGLLQSKQCSLAAVSPDKMATLRCRLTPENEEEDDAIPIIASNSIEAMDAKKAIDFFHQEEQLCKFIQGHDDDCVFVSASEFKHKGAKIPESVAAEIIAEVLKGKWL